MPSVQQNSKQISAPFDGEFFGRQHDDDARYSDAIDVNGAIRALTAAMFVEVMKSARAALALQ